MEDWATFAFEHAPIGLVYTENREIRRCNARFAEMFCYPPEELTGQSLSILYPSSEEFHRIGQLGADKMKITGDYRDERITRRQPGDLFWCRVRGKSIDPRVPFARAIWSFADISEDRPLTDMSLRERQVATMMAEGKTTKEIARALELSPRTVDVHRARLMKKFRVKNSLELVAHIAGVPL
ncbi:MAG: PAS and helix-turn-helix domain-containing protein [Roseibium sp.]|nr:PAS and helix-turn-helix domain-containing protein [Roseibium sp.]